MDRADIAATKAIAAAIAIGVITTALDMAEATTAAMTKAGSPAA